MKNVNAAVRGLAAIVAMLAAAAATTISAAPHAHAAGGSDMCRALAAAGRPILTSADDTATTVAKAPTTVRVLANDHSIGTALVPSTVRFYGYASPMGGHTRQTTLSVPGQGVFTVSATGAITFTAAAGFTGSTTPVCYRVADSAGQSTAAYLTVRVRR